MRQSIPQPCRLATALDSTGESPLLRYPAPIGLGVTICPNASVVLRTVIGDGDPFLQWKVEACIRTSGLQSLRFPSASTESSSPEKSKQDYPDEEDREVRTVSGSE